jgi:hypothetical protein
MYIHPLDHIIVPFRDVHGVKVEKASKEKTK